MKLILAVFSVLIISASVAQAEITSQSCEVECSTKFHYACCYKSDESELLRCDCRVRTTEDSLCSTGGKGAIKCAIEIETDKTGSN